VVSFPNGTTGCNVPQVERVILEFVGHFAGAEESGMKLK